MEKELALKHIVNGKFANFPNDEGQIFIHDFTYDARRMSGAPTISASIMYPSCLDKVWNDSVHTTFNGEKYFLLNTPTSSKDNENSTYKHDVSLVSERIILDNVYFYDVVQSGNDQDRPVSNSTKVFFFGNVIQFAERLMESLIYSKVGYDVVVDDEDEVSKEEKLITFEGEFFSNVLQEVYNTFNTPYYFVGKTIHIGRFEQSAALDNVVFRYGADNNLLSISKANTNNKIVNRIAAEGSSENIPYYYPNDSPYGELSLELSVGLNAYISDNDLFKAKVTPNTTFKAVKESLFTFSDETLHNNGNWNDDKKSNILSGSLDIRSKSTILVEIPTPTSPNVKSYKIVVTRFDEGGNFKDIYEHTWNIGDVSFFDTFDPLYERDYFYVATLYQYFNEAQSEESVPCYSNVSFGVTEWKSGEEVIFLSEYGISVNGDVNSGDTISVKSKNYVNPVGRLMPPIYRDNGERFYNALNDTYSTPLGEKYVFDNPYTEGHPKEHREVFEEIKPSIVGMINANGFRIDQIAEIAFDEKDNNDKEEKEGSLEYKHPFFFVKLRQTTFSDSDTDYSFNLFSCAIEGQNMTFNVTSGQCGGHSFEVAVDEKNHKLNLVQVDENGNLLKDNDGDVVCGRKGKVEAQPRQQDTRLGDTWIALRKDNSTVEGLVMPVSGKFEPIPNQDTFVITNIKLPKAYILDAEKRLEDSAIEYMAKNNSEAFNFSIDFSRVYLANNENVLNALNENSKLSIEYDGIRYELYVNSFSYRMSDGEVLPEIKVDLKDDITIVKNAIQNAINDVKQNVMLQIAGLDIVSVCKPHFLKKNEDDIANGTIDFNKVQRLNEGAEFGTFKKDMSGARIDKRGNSEFESIKARSSISAKEYAINRLSVTDGDQLLTEGDTIINVSVVGDPKEKCYGLYLKKEWDGYVTAQYANNVIKGIVNTLNGRSGEFYTSWMRVNFVNPALNYIEVVMYPDEDTPSGKNYPPCELMKIARWGNQTDKTRQSCIYLSSTEGRIVKLRNVTKPIIDESNIGISLGTVPEFLASKYPQVTEGDDYVYAKGILYQDMIEVDYQGKPVVKPFDRGLWREGELYYSESINPARKVYETSDVWYMGCKYRCAKNLTKTAPAWNNTDWGMIEGNPDFTVDFADTDLVFDPDRFKVTLTVIARLYNQDVTKDILPQDVIWSRYSEDAEGNPRLQSDEAWNLRHGNEGISINLNVEDCDFNGYIPALLRFTATVTLRDNMQKEIAKDSVNFEY